MILMFGCFLLVRTLVWGWALVLVLICGVYFILLCLLFVIRRFGFRQVWFLVLGCIGMLVASLEFDACIAVCCVCCGCLLLLRVFCGTSDLTLCALWVCIDISFMLVGCVLGVVFSRNA